MFKCLQNCCYPHPPSEQAAPRAVNKEASADSASYCSKQHTVNKNIVNNKHCKQLTVNSQRCEELAKFSFVGSSSNALH